MGHYQQHAEEHLVAQLRAELAHVKSLMTVAVVDKTKAEELLTTLRQERDDLQTHNAMLKVSVEELIDSKKREKERFLLDVKFLRDELVALRQKIAEAKPVAYVDVGGYEVCVHQRLPEGMNLYTLEGIKP